MDLVFCKGKDNMCRKNVFNNKGMMTVEAAVIIPLSLFITIMLVWLSFYYYDKNALSAAAAEGAVKGAENAWCSNEEIVQIVEDRIAECLTDRTIFLDDIDMEVTVSFSEIEVRLSSGIKAPDNGIFNTDMWSIDVVKKAPRLQSSEVVRGIKVLEEAVTK